MESIVFTGLLKIETSHAISVLIASSSNQGSDAYSQEPSLLAYSNYEYLSMGVDENSEIVKTLDQLDTSVWALK